MNFNENHFDVIEKAGNKIERTVTTSSSYISSFTESSLIISMILLVARELFPELAKKIPAVYQLIDTYELPIINWLYAVLIKAISWFISLPLIANALEWLKSLAM